MILHKLITSFKTQSIIHFLVIGLLMTVLYTWRLKRVSDEPVSDLTETEISVSQDNILAFLQFREKTFNQASAQARLDAMTAEQKAMLIDDYVLEEVLVREASMMELDRNDYVIRARLAQKMAFLTEGFVSQTLEPTEAEVAAYYHEHQTEYQRAANASFSHIYFATQDPQVARQHLEALNTQRLAEHQVGQPFIYQRHYTNRPMDLITSHFGDGFGQALFALSADSTTWQGPISSQHGMHLVRVTALNSPSTAPLSEIYTLVAEDVRRFKTQQKMDALFAELRNKYQVTDAEWVDTGKDGAYANHTEIDNQVFGQ